MQAQGDDLIVYHVEEFAGASAAAASTSRRSSPHGTPREWLRFNFPRQEGRRRLCIADFFRPAESGQYDVLGVQLVTVGDQRHASWPKSCARTNKYQDYLYLHGFGVESAEALAELWHKRMRQELGFGSRRRPEHPRAVPAEAIAAAATASATPPARISKTGARSSSC